MVKNSLSGAMACVGAVIGAGFASGREIVVFFTRYGIHSWWLIALASTAMMLLCALCMRCAIRCDGMACWCAMFQKRNRSAEICTVLLMAVTGGGMISAAGQMVALLWPHEWAYSLGSVGTLLMAWGCSFSHTKTYGWLGSGLTALFLVIVLWLIICVPADGSIALGPSPSLQDHASAAARAVGYAAMNMTLAIGVVCRCTGRSMRDIRRLSGIFGAAMAVLLCISNGLYMRHPALFDLPFPIVSLLAGFGRKGFIISVILLYLSIGTTLVAVMYALRTAVEAYVHSSCPRMILSMGLPLAISAVGFSGIVEGMYAPAGAICLLVVFVPLVKKTRGSKEKLDNPLVIQ